MEAYEETMTLAIIRQWHFTFDELLLVPMLHEAYDKVRGSTETPPAGLLSNFLQPSI
jgi:hypothetical protein